ncbi:MAG: GGDEF domain-containing protein [Treponema sp.]|jgi:diguanylate cyclase (GGDEF)-like protein|nr:GGDEF domain-containing protein [Treponema sp.]
MDKTKEYQEHILKLLHDNEAPELPEEFSKHPLFIQVHEELISIREIIYSFSAGNFSSHITARGFIPSCLKALQANLRHLVWQIQMVEKGDFSQKVDFMGDFSAAFNKMIRRLWHSFSEQKEKEKKLTESEARFKFMASMDSLTGIYNRRSFIELAVKKLAYAAEEKIPCCLAMMDIDHFKKFNDTYGHLEGDKALCHVVKVIEESLRKNDFMGRYGGEEFILFFYGANSETGYKAAERLRNKIAETPVVLENNSVSVYASFGFVENIMEDSSDKDYVQRLINDADTALYAAKNSGRNKVVLYNPETQIDAFAKSR